jgi:UDP:flavonoid glycosyltransferase YjiC (YdhE family)
MVEVGTMLGDHFVEPLGQLDALAGLPEGRVAAALDEATFLSSVPESLDRAGDPDYPDSLEVLRFREPTNQPAADMLPAWGDPAQPLVYVTFGSVTGSLPPFADVFREALDALADLPARVLMTVGRRVEPAGLGPLPANAHVEQWLPQAAVLAQASAMLGHGGFGTTLGALAAGVPQVVAPIFTSDQVVNGTHVAAAGAGRTVPPGPDVVLRGAGEMPGVLDDVSYAAAARALAAEIAALPPASAAVPVLQRLVG